MGLQCAVIEFSRNVCDLKNANTTEFIEDEDQKIDHPVICLMEEQANVDLKGGTMRLGSYQCDIVEGTKVSNAYKQKIIFERHRHRYEVNNYYRELLEKNGMILSGLNKELEVVEMIELKNHPWFIGTQAHPEFKSQPISAHPLFKGFVQAAYEFKTSIS